MKLRPKTLRRGLEHEARELMEWAGEIGDAGRLEKVLRLYTERAVGDLQMAIELLKQVEQERKGE